MSKTHRISALLDAVLDGTSHPQRLLDRLLVKAMDQGLDWHDIVCAVDEAERRTGLRLHPMGGPTGGRAD
ncbi:MAG TPA: hypothetical protein VD995_28760 [Azospirillum sp.]|nr:hypothetical protein [Azospirillum sp.]